MTEKIGVSPSVMGERVKLLDHGYMQLVESWGSDEAIIRAARMSTDKGFLGWGPICIQCGSKSPDGFCASGVAGDLTHAMEPGDEKLLRYLWEHHHSTPFEFAGMVVEVNAPIFIYRQWHRHRVFSFNEMSARYTPLPDENYTPTVERLMAEAGKNKQARGATDMTLTEDQAATWLQKLDDVYTHAEQVYQAGLRVGVPKELARLHLPVARYSKMRASANLRNWLGFLTLRMDSHAQWEIQQYANAAGSLIEKLFPRTWELFIKGRSDGC